MFDPNGEVAGRERDGLPELQRRVGEWRQKTYGRNIPWKATAAKLREEADECAQFMEFWEGMCGEVIEEMADVLIVILGVCDRYDIDILEAIEKKLKILNSPDRNQPARDRIRGIEVALEEIIETARQCPLAAALAAEEVGG